MILKRLFKKICLERSSHVLAFAKFGLVGATTAGIYFFVLWGADSVLGFNYILAVSAAYVISTAFHFLANRHFTFAAIDDKRTSQLVRYSAMWVFNYLITIVVVSVCVERYLLSPYVGVCISVLFTMITGYILARYWVFKIKEKSMSFYIVTGCAGFIGSNLVDRLLAGGHRVTGIDNFSTGQRRFLEGALVHANFRLVEVDLLDLDALKQVFTSGEIVFHLAANADVRFGTEHPRKDLEQNTIVTYNVLEAMRANGIKKIAFSSTGSVYGDTSVIPTPEDGPFPIQTSLYGASKAAGEGMIAAYCEGFGFQAWIFRFVSILGERYSHGHVFDFYKKLKADPTRLHVLGNGKQRKSYLYIQDCIDAMLKAVDMAREKVNILNLGVDGYCQVNDSIGWICEQLGVSPQLDYSGGERGWIGDNPFIHLDTKKMQSLGWQPKLTIREGVIKTVQYLQENKWVFEARE